MVTFLDPFGVAVGKQEMLSLLARRRTPSEVLLNINLEAVARIGGYLEPSVNGSVAIKPNCREQGVERADDFFGGTWWRERFLDARVGDGSAARAAENVVDQYRSAMRKATGCESMSVPIRRRPGHHPLFHLTLFYRSPAAGYKFADAASRATRRWRDAYRKRELDEALDLAGVQSAFDFNEVLREHSTENADLQERQLRSEWTDIVIANLRVMLRTQARIRVGHDIRGILGSTLSLAGESEILTAWDRLAREGLIVQRSINRDLWKSEIVRR